MSCGFAGNTDIYGIGIRIGYYTQAVAVWFSNYFLYREAKSLRAVNNIFLLALCIAATIYYANASTTHVIEAFLMLQIGLVIGLVGITERSRYSSKYVKNSSERMVLRMVIIMAGSLFNVCFWWRELDVMLPTPCSGRYSRDKTYIFYIVKANAYGWAGILMKIKSLAAVVWTAPRIITFDAVVLLYNIRMRKTRAAFTNAVQSSTSTLELNQKIDTQQRGGHHSSCPSKKRPLMSPAQNNDKNPGNGSTPFKRGKIKAHELQTRDHLEGIDLLQGVDQAIQYLENIFSIYPTNTANPRKKRPINLCCGLIQFSIPYRESICTDRSASTTECLTLWLKSNFTNNPSFDLRWMLALHMTASGQHPSWRWPRLLHRMFILGEEEGSKTPPDWRHVAIASDILLMQIPVVITRRIWMLTASYQFLFIVALILQVELTIAWNGVGGLNQLSSLGQLIPFILGVGGLLKVVWGKWKLIVEGRGEERYVPNGVYEDAMVRFWEGRKAGVKNSVVRAATA